LTTFPDELYAILSLESYRSRTVVVGEDLGTVPHYVRPMMKNHGVHRMYVMHYELASADTRKILKPVPADSIASLNTHDMFPFAAVWDGTDIEQRAALGLINRATANREKRLWEERKRALVRLLQGKGFLDNTPASVEEALKACLAFLSASDAAVMLVNLEDLWLEARPQNIPLDELCQIPRIIDTLRMVNQIRKRREPSR